MNSNENSLKLDITSLKNSIHSLKSAIDTYTEFSQKPDIAERDLNTIKSGVIQNFEVAYEQCWKFMKRWLEGNVGSGSADGVTRKELFRLSAENHLITDVGAWFGFHLARNLTSHTYDGDSAKTVFDSALAFYAAANDFYVRLEARND